MTREQLEAVAAMVGPMGSGFAAVSMGSNVPERVDQLVALGATREVAVYSHTRRVIEWAILNVAGVEFRAQSERAATEDELAALSSPTAVESRSFRVVMVSA
jgi:hypothetical protein